MNHTPTEESEAALRGPFLAAHRALRKAVDSESGGAKGASTVVAARLRETPGDKALMAELIHIQQTNKALQICMNEFGGPDKIPETTGFQAYLHARMTQMQEGLARDTSNEKYRREMLEEVGPNSPRTTFWQRSAAKARSQLAGRVKFAELFDKAFGEVQAQLPKA